MSAISSSDEFLYHFVKIIVIIIIIIIIKNNKSIVDIVTSPPVLRPGDSLWLYALLAARHVHDPLISPVYRIQPVVKPVVNPFDNRLTTGCIVYTAGWQSGCTTRFDNRLNEQWLFVQHGCQTGCQTGLTTGSVVSCKRGIMGKHDVVHKTGST